MIRVGMVGSSPGNGHPYSFSAILNGYDPAALAVSPYPSVLEYLNRQPPEAFGVEDARVTHIWTADRREANHIALACHIPTVVGACEEMLGHVDAVILPHDEARLHLSMALPFVRAGVPVFIDKPLADSAADLRELAALTRTHAPVMSCSALRYADELAELKAALPTIGQVASVHGLSWRSWMRYGVHLVEAVYVVLGRGVTEVRNFGRGERGLVHFRYPDGPDVFLDVGAPVPPMIRLMVYGSAGQRCVDFVDWFAMFKRMLTEFVTMVKTRRPPIAIQETQEIVALLLAAQWSLERGGVSVALEEVLRS